MSIKAKLMHIQSELKAPKNQYNAFGKYKYRSQEDILEGVKPLLKKHEAVLVVTDEIVLIGDRYYIKSKAELMDAEKQESIFVTGYSREDENKKGMDSSQLTGSTSSYARKYALNGLFAIDDTKDSDSTNTHSTTNINATNNATNASSSKSNYSLNEKQIKRLFAIAYSVNIDSNTVKEQVKKKFNKDVKELTKEEYENVCKGYEGLKK